MTNASDQHTPDPAEATEPAEEKPTRAGALVYRAKQVEETASRLASFEEQLAALTGKLEAAQSAVAEQFEGIAELAGSVNNLCERLDAHEAAEKTADEKATEMSATWGFAPDAAPTASEDDQTPDGIKTKFLELRKTDSLAATRFFRENKEALRAVAN